MGSNQDSRGIHCTTILFLCYTQPLFTFTVPTNQSLIAVNEDPTRFLCPRTHTKDPQLVGWVPPTHVLVILVHIRDDPTAAPMVNPHLSLVSS